MNVCDPFGEGYNKKHILTREKEKSGKCSNFKRWPGDGGVALSEFDSAYFGRMTNAKLRDWCAIIQLATEEKEFFSFACEKRVCHSLDSTSSPVLPDAPFTFLKLFYKCLQCCVICNWMSGKSAGAVAGTGHARKVSATGKIWRWILVHWSCEMDSCWVTERWEVFTDNIHLKLSRWRSRITCTNKWTEIPWNEFRFSFRSFPQIKLN